MGGTPPRVDDAVQAGIEAIHSAREFVPSSEPRWQPELQLLALQESALIELSQGPQAALDYLKGVGPFESRLYYTQLATLLDRMQQTQAAQTARESAQKFPANHVTEKLQSGMDLMRAEDFSNAIARFDSVLLERPDHFAARLFQAICFLEVSRPSEARIALTACIAQRPYFQWNYYLRAQAELELKQIEHARQDLRVASAGRTQSQVSHAAQKQLQTLPEPDQPSSQQELE